MIGVWGEYAKEYLYVVAIGSCLFFGLPMVFIPLRWARIFQWIIPEHTHLTIYFGRCLGGIICVMAVFAIVATRNATTLQFFYGFILVNFIVMIFVHIYGAIKKIQPKAETLEILYWLGLAIATLLFYPPGQ